MAIGNYVKNKQPFVFKTFSYALQQHRLAHAYLLLGEPGTPLKETAIYMAKSILCDHPEPLADETCSTCNRVENGEYPDFVLCDGSQASIKKEEITSLVSAFQQTALERKGIRIYVIHLVENMTVESVNALLKFLEEPPAHAYAILTTENESKVLPTIVSRCQAIRMLLYPRSEVVKESLALGADPLDAELLSHFYNEPSLLLEASKDEDYELAKSLFTVSLDALSKEEDEARYLLEKEVIPSLNKKPAMRFYIDALSVAFEDVVRIQDKLPVHLSSLEDKLKALSARFEDGPTALSKLLSLRGEIELNIPAGFLLTHLVFLLHHQKQKDN